MSSRKICPVCNTENSLEAETCVNCHTSLIGNTTARVSEEPPEVRRGEQAREITHAHADALALYVMGNDKPILIRGKSRIVLGRTMPGSKPPTVDLTDYMGVLLGVSRHHVAIDTTQRNFTVEDLGSMNGTWLNDKRLQPNTPQLLHNGDQLRLGHLVIYVYFYTVDADEETIYLTGQDELGSSERFTLTHLTNAVTPYLKAIVGFQAIIDELRDSAASEMGILSIVKEQRSISIKLTGVNEALQLMTKYIVPWRSQYSEQLARLRAKKQTTESAGATQVLSPGGDTPPRALTGTQLLPGDEASEETRPTTEKLHLELRHAQTLLAMDILKELAPQLSDQSRSALLKRLVPILWSLVFSSLDISLQP